MRETKKETPASRTSTIRCNADVSAFLSESAAIKKNHNAVYANFFGLPCTLITPFKIQSLTITYQPGTHIVHPATINVKSGSVTVCPDMHTVHPDTITVQSGTHSVLPDTHPVLPETHPVRPEMRTVHPDTITVQTETHTVQPDTIPVQPGTHPVHPDMHPVQSGTLTVQPDTIAVQSVLIRNPNPANIPDFFISCNYQLAKCGERFFYKP